jgi:hypothetical protein
MGLHEELRERVERLAAEFADTVLEVTAQVIAEHLRAGGFRVVESAPVAAAASKSPPAPPSRRSRAPRIPAARILRVVTAHREGLSADALREGLGLPAASPMPRALAVLVASGRVREITEGGRKRYAIPSGPAPSTNGMARGSSSPVAVKPAAPPVMAKTNGHTVKRGSETFF